MSFNFGLSHAWTLSVHGDKGSMEKTQAMGRGRPAPGMIAKLEAALAEAWAAVDAAWVRIGAQEQARRDAPRARAADGFGLGGGGGDRSTIALP